MDIIKEFQKLENPEKAIHLQRFFKTGKGQYGEGDIFLGITVPEQRKIANKFNLSLDELQKLLDSKIHEHRLTSLFILNKKFKKADKREKQEIFDFYLKNVNKSNINNWDLVDSSAHKIIGNFLEDKDRKILYNLAKSKNLWEKRISIISAFWFIKNNEFQDAINLAEILLNDKHDLIHKAVGWMLREIGKRDKSVLINFLNKHLKKMPRTMLRYSIEKLNKNEKQKYMKK